MCVCRQNKNTWFPIVQCLKTFHYLIYIFSFSTFKTEGGSKICLVYIKYMLLCQQVHLLSNWRKFSLTVCSWNHTQSRYIYNVTPHHIVLKQLCYELFAVRGTLALLSLALELITLQVNNLITAFLVWYNFLQHVGLFGAYNDASQ